MPRFYFDVNVGKVAQDDEGLEFPNLLVAEREARQALGEIARDVLFASAPVPLLVINIRDDQGQHLRSISLTYADGSPGAHGIENQAQ